MNWNQIANKKKSNPQVFNVDIYLFNLIYEDEL